MKKIYMLLTIILSCGALSVTGCYEKHKNIDSSYEIVTESQIINEIGAKKNNSKRDYDIKEYNGDYYLVIYYGEVSAYYSKLDVTKIEFEEQLTKVYIKLPENEGVGDAFSYPIAVIKFNKKPEKIKIIYD